MSSTGRPKIILVSPLSEDMRGKDSARGAFYPPLGTMLVASQLKDEGFDVDFFDGNLRYDYEQGLTGALKDNPLFVGMYVTFLQLPAAIALSKAVKGISPSAKIVWGGPFPSIFSDTIMKENFVDCVVLNDGAATTRKMAVALREGAPFSEIQGIRYHNLEGNPVSTGGAPEDNFDSLCNIDYDLVNVDDYCDKFDVYLERARHAQIKRSMPVLTGLGCSYKCGFCENALLNNRHRSKSAKDIIGEIKYLMKRYMIDSFALFDEDFFIDKKRCLEFIDLIKKEGLKFNWGTQVRANYFNNNYICGDFVRRLEESGCIHLAVGAESGSQKVLDFINKQILVGDLINSAEILMDSPITISYSFINFLPEENLSDRIKSYKLIQKLTGIKKNSFVSSFHTYYPYPGTPLTQHAQRRYNFRFPGRLDEFSKIAMDFEHYVSKILPWYNKAEVKRNKVVYFYFYQLIYAKNHNSGNSKFLSWLRKILVKISGLRCKNDFYIFPFEYYLVNAFKLIRNIE